MDLDSTILTPELMGPIFKAENITLRQALYNNNTNRRFRLLATFVPDELIFLVEEEKKLTQCPFVAILFLDITDLYELFEEYGDGDHGGSSGLSRTFYMFTSSMIEQICFNGGDVFKFTDNGILSVWKQNSNESVHDLLRRVISCAFNITEVVQSIDCEFFDVSQAPVKSAISAGSVTFAAIGEGDSCHFVVTGEPVTVLKKATKLCKPADIILTKLASKHCILSDYVYIIYDNKHIKLTKELKKSSTAKVTDKKNIEVICRPEFIGKQSTINKHRYFQTYPVITSSKTKLKSKCIGIVQNKEVERHIIESRHMILDACRSQLGLVIRDFVIRPVRDQIENDKPLEYLTEMRNMTVVLIEIATTITSIPDLLTFAGECHKIMNEACGDTGIIEDVKLRKSTMTFRLVFGIRSYLKNLNHCQIGVDRAWKLLISLRKLEHLDAVSIGVSSGISCCIIIGHVARRHYAIVGPQIARAENVLLISRNKVTCDLNTVIYSGIKRSNFQAAGLINLKGIQKGYVYTYFDENESENPESMVLKKSYPILSRFKELELFDDILDQIGLHIRTNTGILVEGDGKVGKSRILDAFAVNAKARKMRLVKLVLHKSYAAKPYAVIYEVLIQILNAEECRTIEEIERIVSNKLCNIIHSNELCYMNRILRVRFKLSQQYIMDSDWNRHQKSINIFDKIIRLNGDQICILLDNSHYMDYMSWKFLSHSMTYKNIVLAMTILKAQSWQDLSRVESDIFNDERLLLAPLEGLDPGSLTALMCQFLSVQAISTELHDFLLDSKITHPGWFELFVSSMIVCGALDFKYLTPEEISSYELIFPDLISVTRISADFLPEEVAPPLPWKKRHKILICITNEKFSTVEPFKTLDLHSLVSELFSRLSGYEQDIVCCASVVGKVFSRSMIETMIRNHSPMKTSAAVENLMRARIVECAAIQRQKTKIGDLVVCSFKPRQTFSDIHHVVKCRCTVRYIPPEEQHLSRYAHCNFMEFKNSIFQKWVNENIPDIEKKKYHVKIVEVYKKDARKCTACGGGSFLRIPGREKTRKLIRSTNTGLSANNTRLMSENPFTRTPSVAVSEKESESDVKSASPMTGGRGYSTMRSSFETTDSEEVEEVTSQKRKSKLKLCKKSRVHPVTCQDVTKPYFLHNLGYVDFRNCRCLGIIECVFLKLQLHIEYAENNETIVEFMMEYAAALISYGQPGYALRFLAIADERNDFVDTRDTWKNPSLYGKIVKKSMILCLRGNAYMRLGNYSQAKINYIEAMLLYKYNFNCTDILTKYKTAYGQMKQNIQWRLLYPETGENTLKYERKMVMRQSIALCLRHLAEILMMDNHFQMAKLTSLQSIRFGFSSYDASCFYDQCRLYISAVDIYSQLGELKFLNHTEKYILFAIHQKRDWNNIEDIVALAHVYSSIFKVSLLQGELTRAVHFGRKALRIAKSFSLIKLEYDLLLSLVQVMMHLKLFSEAMDMLQQLRGGSSEDIDKSSLTWYYALCMDLILDAGILVETFENCAAYAQKILVGRSGAYVSRDSRSLRRLLAGLWMWQLRKGDLKTTVFVRSLDYFMDDLKPEDYSQIITLCKILECHLILLTRCINMKRGNQMEILIGDIEYLMDVINGIIKISPCIKPYYYILRAHYCLLHDRTFLMKSYLFRAKKYAEKEENLMALAWINHNKNTWEAVNYNNMARYWEENMNYRLTLAWQDVDIFELDDWSNLLYSLPIPDSHI
ncbi:hypothetical protein QAD02_000858 [Eretmocerus hayati]|uniref:Uncharacterized protein n=1 Tax=Eretmocerus hayati TaxID=131215 RepID=A0ACC2NEU2_9HYME|nr:hypothetical protein QAD02_000858 [Eretmocerus hayati]